MRPSVALETHREQVSRILARLGMSNVHVFGSVARGQDTEASDLDLIVDVQPATSLYDLAQAEIELEALLGCKVEVMTKGFLAPDVLARAEPDLIRLP
jgi:predicted nucleotidyltransferase